jgi:hypothetical protein
MIQQVVHIRFIDVRDISYDWPEGRLVTAWKLTGVIPHFSIGQSVLLAVDRPNGRKGLVRASIRSLAIVRFDRGPLEYEYEVMLFEEVPDGVGSAEGPKQKNLGMD